MKKTTLRKIMKRAWEIAREGVKKFGGKVREYLSIAMKTAWFELKKPKKIFEFECDKFFKTPEKFWEYCNKRLKKFDTCLEDFIGTFQDWSDPLFPTKGETIHYDWDLPRRDISNMMPYNYHIYQSKLYNYIMEFDFLDETGGFGYCYLKEME